MEKTLVMGASLKPDRYSNLAVNRLRDHGKEVLAYGNTEGFIKDVKIHTALEDFKDETIDTVSLYLNPDNQKPFYQAILNLKPRRVIFNPGTENMDFIQLLSEHQIQTEASCMLVLLATNQY